MGRIIAIANQKGGVGKTTTAINLSACLAEAEKRVLTIDMDPQGNTTSGLGIDKNNCENTIYQLILGECSFDEALIHTEFEYLDLIPSNVNLAGAEIELLNIENREYVLHNEIEKIKDNYDFIIIDCPPSLNMLTVNAMTTASTVLVPIQCEYYALEGVADLINTINLVKKRLRTPVPIKGILLTLYDKRTRLSKDVYKELKNHFGSTNLLFNTVIPRNIRLAEAPSYGKPCLIYDSESTGTKAYLSLAKEIIERDGGN